MGESSFVLWPLTTIGWEIEWTPEPLKMEIKIQSDIIWTVHHNKFV